MRFLTWLFTTAVALAAAAWVMDGISFRGADQGMAEVQDKLPVLLVVALILGLVSAVVKPVLTVLQGSRG
jgi:putative membrane protein